MMLYERNGRKVMITCYRCNIWNIKNAYMYELVSYKDDWTYIDSFRSTFISEDSGELMSYWRIVRNDLRLIPMAIDYRENDAYRPGTGRVAFQYKKDKVCCWSLKMVCESVDGKLNFDEKVGSEEIMVYPTGYECT